MASEPHPQPSAGQVTLLTMQMCQLGPVKRKATALGHACSWDASTPGLFPNMARLAGAGVSAPTEDTDRSHGLWHPKTECPTEERPDQHLGFGGLNQGPRTSCLLLGLPSTWGGTLSARGGSGGVTEKPSSRAQPTEGRTPSPFWGEQERSEVLEASLLQENHSSCSPASIAHPFLISFSPKAATLDQPSIPSLKSQQLGVLANLPPSPSRPCDSSSRVCREVAVRAVSRLLWSTLPAPVLGAFSLHRLLPVSSPPCPSAHITSSDWCPGEPDSHLSSCPGPAHACCADSARWSFPVPPTLPLT